jgi:hypothetical protein
MLPPIFKLVNTQFYQAVMLALLRRWQLPGFLSHVDSVVEFYRRQVRAQLY